MNPPKPIMGDSAPRRLDRLELDLADIRAQLAALVRLAHLDRAQRTLERTDPRSVRTARARCLLCELADGIGPTTWSTAWAVRLVLTGEDPPPTGFERIAVMLRDHYNGRAPAQGTIWRAMRDRRTWLEAGR